MRPMPSAPDGRAAIPLTVVGGPSGMGKTSVMRHLLAADDGRRVVAVVRQNIGADHESASLGARYDTRLEWTDGGASSVSEDPTDALLSLTRLERRPDHVIVEVTGSENPQRLRGYGYMPGFRPDGVVTVVDAGFARFEETGQTLSVVMQEQLRVADVVVLNKLDLAGPRAAAASQRSIALLAPSARFLWCQNGRIAPALLLGPAPGRRVGDDDAVVAEWRSDYLPACGGAGRARQAGACRSWCLVAEEGLDTREFRSWVARLPDTVLRGTGVVHLREEPQHRHEFSLIGARWQLTRGAPWRDEPPSTRITVVSLDSERDGATAVARRAERRRWTSPRTNPAFEPSTYVEGGRK